MAVTVSTGVTKGRAGPNALGARPTAVYSITFDSSYPTNGEAVNLAALCGFTPAFVFFSQRAPLTGGYHFVWDRTNKKILVFWVDTTVDGAAMAEVANTTNLSTLVVDVLLVGD